MRDHVPGWNLAGNEPGASCDGDTGPQGAHLNPKPGNHPELRGETRQQPPSALAGGLGDRCVCSRKERENALPQQARFLGLELVDFARVGEDVP